MDPASSFHVGLSRSAAKAREELEPLAQVLALHSRTKEELANVKEENVFLRGQVDALRTELATAAAAAPASSSDRATAANAASTAKLQTKLLELQDQLTDHYRTQAQETAKKLALSEANQKLKEESVVMHQRMVAAQQEAQHLQEERDRLRGALQEREAQLSTAAEELVRVRRLMENKARECDDLRRDAASIEGERQQFAAALAALEAKADTMRRDRDKAVANVQAAQQRIGELMKAANAPQASSSAATAADGTGFAAAASTASPGAAAGAISTGSVVGSPLSSSSTTGVGTPVMTTSSFGTPIAPATAPLPAPSGGTAAAASGVDAQQQQQGAAGLLSWLGNRVSAVVQKATGAPAPSPASATAPQTLSPAPSALQSSPYSSSSSSSSMGLSLYMSSSVAGLAADYVFASLSTPSKPLHVIKSVGASGAAGSTEVNAVKIHDTGRIVACGSSDGNISLWNLTTGAREGILYTATEGNAVLSVDCGGTVICGGCTDRTIRVFDLTTQRVVRSLTGHGGKVQALVFIPPTSASGNTLSAGGNFAGAGGGAGPTGGFSRGLLFSGGADRMVKLWDLRDGRCIKSIDTRSIVNGIAVSPDGMLIAIANQDGAARLFDLRGGSGLVAENSSVHSSALTSVCFSTHDSGGRLLTASRDNSLRVLDGRTLDPLTSFAPPTGVPHSHDRKPSNDFQQAAARRSVSGTSSGGSPMLTAMAAGGSADSPTLRPLSELSLGGGRTARASSMSASGQQQPLASSMTSSTSSLSIVMKGGGFRVPVNYSRALYSPNGHYAVCGGDHGTVYSFNAETGVLDTEIGLSESEIQQQLQQQKRKSSFTAGSGGLSSGSGEYGGSISSGRTPRGGSFAVSSSSADSSYALGGGLPGPHEGAAIFALDYAGYTMVTGDEKGRVVIWGE